MTSVTLQEQPQTFNKEQKLNKKWTMAVLPKYPQFRSTLYMYKAIDMLLYSTMQYLVPTRVTANGCPATIPSRLKPP